MDDASQALAAIDAFAANPALAALVTACGGSPPSSVLLNYLDDFAAANWDFRGGRERNLAPVATISESIAKSVKSLAPQLGQGWFDAQRDLGQQPAHFDAIVMTGGMVRAGLVKPRFVHELLAGGVTADEVVFLGAFRQFQGDEAELARALGVDGDNETDAMMAGMLKHFAPTETIAVVGADGAEPGSNGSWQEWSWQRDGIRFSVVAAESSDAPNRRANTADTYRFWAQHRRPARLKSVLLVTTPVYVPYQAAVGVEIFGLEFGLAVSTVGTSEVANDLGEHTQRFEAQHHLQELRAALSALRRLREKLAQL